MIEREVAFYASCASELRLERFCLEVMKSLKTKRGIAVKRERARHEPRRSRHLKKPWLNTSGETRFLRVRRILARLKWSVSGTERRWGLLVQFGFAKIYIFPNSRLNAKWFKDNNYDKWILARDGEKALSDKVEPYIKRDASRWEIWDVLVADGHLSSI